MQGEAIARALASDKTIDITTTGRRSGRPHRVEIWFHHVAGRIFISGRPGRRDWYANMLADPRFTFHLKESVQADLPAGARPIRDETERRHVFGLLLPPLGRQDRLEEWVAGSPLVEVEFLSNDRPGDL